MTVGAIGVAGTSYISYKQFKTDCTEYFEQYKKHYDEYKYLSLYNFIYSVTLIIRYLEKYIIDLADDDNAAPPNVDNIKESFNKSIEENLKAAQGSDKNLDEIRNSISFFD